MRNILLLTLSFFSFNTVISQNKSVEKSKTNSIAYLQNYKGKYPFQVKLFRNAPFVNRVKALVGSRYKLIQKDWNVESPIEVDSGYFKAWACRAHECPRTNFLIVYNFSEDKMYVGIRENEKSQIYSENGEQIPLVMKEWAKEENLIEDIQSYFKNNGNGSE